ncbi:hypothetical protein VTI74DRAFT_9957 [Chaetomium olivicolor]
MPAPRQRIFRGIPQADSADGSSSSEDSDSSTIRQRSGFDRFGGVAMPRKRKRQETEHLAPGQDLSLKLSDFDSDNAESLAEISESHQQSHRSQHYPSQPSRNLSQLSDGPTTPRRQRAAQAGFGGLPTPATGNSFSSCALSDQPGPKRFRVAQGLAAQQQHTDTGSIPRRIRHRTSRPRRSTRRRQHYGHGHGHDHAQGRGRVSGVAAGGARDAERACSQVAGCGDGEGHVAREAEGEGPADCRAAGARDQAGE